VDRACHLICETVVRSYGRESLADHLADRRHSVLERVCQTDRRVYTGRGLEDRLADQRRNALSDTVQRLCVEGSLADRPVSLPDGLLDHVRALLILGTGRRFLCTSHTKLHLSFPLFTKASEAHKTKSSIEQKVAIYYLIVIYAKSMLSDLNTTRELKAPSP
jgi:hypothetical protein